MGVAVVPYHQTVTNRLTRLLRHRNIKVTSPLLPKVKQQLRSVKDSLGWKVPKYHVNVAPATLDKRVGE